MLERTSEDISIKVNIEIWLMYICISVVNLLLFTDQQKFRRKMQRSCSKKHLYVKEVLISQSVYLILSEC